MFPTFARSLIAFGVVFVAYQVYALVVPPLLESPATIRSRVALNEEDWRGGSDAVARYQKLLAHYLPTGHWSLTGPIKVLESGSMLVVFEDWDRSNQGRVTFTKCAVIMFPTPRGDGRTTGPVAPRDAVVLEAPGDPALGFAAELQFDDDFDPTRGKIGQITGGRFPGPITIRSDGVEPGVEDDLWIETRDLRLAGPLLFTPHEVQVRHGMSRGQGRRLEIKLIEEPGGAVRGGLKIAGVESIEVFENVRLELQTGNLNLTGDESPRRVTQASAIQRTAHTSASSTPVPPRGSTEADAWAGPQLAQPAPGEPAPLLTLPPAAPLRPALVATPKAPSPPVEVTCEGSFRMDLVRFVATFNQRVHARQLNLNGQSDQLFCERLDLHFVDDKTRRPDPASDPDFSSRQRNVARDLQARRLVAYGEPVKLDAPARGAIARGRKLEIDIEHRQITLGGVGAFFKHPAGEVHAPLVRYEHPAQDSPSPIGRLWVGGPGWLRTSKRGSGDEGLTARWRETPAVSFPVRLVHRKVGPALVVLGDPQVTAAGVGQLNAERIEIAMKQTPADGPNGPAIEVGAHTTALLPERIDATGNVSVRTPEIEGRTDELTVWVRPGNNRAAPVAGPSPNVLRSRTATPTQSTPTNRYTLTAQKMELDALFSAGRTTPHRLVCSGGAQFRQLPTLPQDQPLVVTGDRIRVDRLHTRRVRVDVHGGAPGQNGSATPQATIAAQGVTLRAADVHLDQQTNRMWADGVGQAHLQTDSDLLGQSTNASTDLHLRWRGGLSFDGQRITIEKEVFGEGPHDWLRTNKLVATLARPIDFSGKSSLKNTRGSVVEIAKIEGSGGVTIDHRSIDPTGQRSHERAQLETLTYVRRTGELSGSGPGWVRSVHLSDSKGFALGGTDANSHQQPTSSGDRLRYLRVDFLQGITGNVNTRVMAFHGRVRAVYGPVLAWQHEIPMTHPNGLPPDVATLASEHLQVNEDPTHRSVDGKYGPLELLATGAVNLETARRDGGVFTAQANTASYTQAKDLFTIEGLPGAYATIWMQDQPGRTPKVQSARKFSFWRRTNQMKIEDLGGFDSAPGVGPPAQGPAAASRPTTRR